jgi:homoprotocatechuate degradation regulator HpaR
LKHLIVHRNLPQRLLMAREGLVSNFRPILNYLGVTEQQWRVLRVLDEHEKLEPREIGEMCMFSSASMTGVLGRMAALGLIERSRMAEDQRRVVIRLSEQGNELLSRGGPLIDAQYQNIEEAYGPQIFVDLFKVLDELIDLKKTPIKLVDLP